MLGIERAFFRLSFVVYNLLVFLLFSDVNSQIPLGSKISVEENNYWLSSNGDFAVGFFNVLNQYSVGICFNSSSIPVNSRKVVWVAGADRTVGSKSYFQLSQEGELVLFDSLTGDIAWTSKTQNVSVASAVLRNDGNLVLLNVDKNPIWQSFDAPCDTLLPGQNLSVHQILRPPSRNSVSSYYSLFMNDSGQLQLRWETSVIYWTEGNPSQSTLHATISSDGTFQLLDNRSESVWSIFGEDHNDSDVKFRFLRLDADGNLRMYSWLNGSKSWRSVWQAFDNQCDVFATCGLRGICALNESGFQVCRCPFMVNGESNLKCLVPYRQSCTSGGSLIMYDHTFLYGIYPANETVVRTSLQKCQNLCNEDKNCIAVSFTNDKTPLCHILKTQYISGKFDASLSSISFVKTCSDPIAVFPTFPKSNPPPLENIRQNSSSPICIPCLVGVSAATFVMFILIQFGLGLYIFKWRTKIRKKSMKADSHPFTDGCITLSYSEIRCVTEDFKHQIGPKMFRGTLPDNRPVAVKELDTTVELRKFRTAVSRIGSIHHKNLVKLEGYCFESGHRFLVYEFVSNGSLGKCLKDPKLCKSLTWGKRMKISLEVARAVSYLHTGCRDFVCHGNLKCKNVVLEDNLEAKVTEFGLRTILSEVSEVGGLADTDVRDFGNLLLVLISGYQNSEVCEWAYAKWVEGHAETISDAQIEGGVNPEELEHSLRIAFWCLQVDERMRPSMGEVIQVLEGTLPVDPPPNPFTLLKAPKESWESDEAT
ncbi:G-type lectin S-receptor-like serine threonine-kinase SD3-1 [Olea europaea subsp. europaea]|uniref:Receptor-like serine/threonine-protein kinase n=1 Tax=Olea europaea subsp. europaea TaxID=158383 RepID=A0A8S0SPA9_OLEEU|nr:G-type lectin S-receptor-like serine threonine-kinase SD3-1 [Olea europaea subsp. europaea]